MYFGFTEDGGAGKGGGGRSYRKAEAQPRSENIKEGADGQMYKELMQGRNEECRHLMTWAQGQEGPLERQDALRAMWGIWTMRILGRMNLKGL